MGREGIRRARRAVGLLAAGLAIGWCCALQAQTVEIRGEALPGLESFDSELVRVMQAWGIPGASLAVAKDGKLLLAKGYGVADVDTRTPMTPGTLLRMGSINKTVTAVAVLKLVEENKLSLDDPVVPLLMRRGTVTGRVADPRALTITVRQLLQHSAGLDRDRSGDPFFQPLLRDVARRQGTHPVTCEAIIKDTLERPLDFTPGERYAYSNTGYCMLGRVVEAASGEAFRQYASRVALRPSVGKDFLTGRSMESLPGETRYHTYPGQPDAIAAPGMGASLRVPSPYGSYSIESMDALGAWVATPVEVLKFFLAIDGARGDRILSAQSVRLMQEPPPFPETAGNQRRFYGLGTQILRTAQGNNWWHGGSQPGVAALALRAANGYAWVVAFNSRPPDKDRQRFASEFDEALWRAARAVQRWPSGDLF